MSKVPYNPVIPHSRPTLGEEEVQAVAEVIRSGHIAQRDVVRKLEQAVAAKVGAPHAVATSSGTAALHLALRVLGVGVGDEVIIPSYVCSALLNAVRYVGAEPIIADIDRRSGNMDPDDASRRISNRTKAAIVPHMFGLPAEMDAFLKLGIPVIEDCAQTIGTTSKGRPVGSLGHLSICSFYATKVLTTGEGGMVISGSAELMEKIRDLNEYDNKNDAIVRHNYKMTDMQAAMGLMQLQRLHRFISRRKEIAEKYRKSLETIVFDLPPNNEEHIYFRFIIDVGKEVDRWIDHMGKENIAVARPVYRPLHILLGLEGYPVTEFAWKSLVSLPIYPSLSDEEIDRIVKVAVSIGRCGR